MAEARIRAGDYVKHIPSGEEWVVCGVSYERDELVPCGYPFPTLARLHDCVLTKSNGLPQPQDYKNALMAHGMPSLVEVDT